MTEGGAADVRPLRFLQLERNCRVSGGSTFALLLAQALVQHGHAFTYAAGGGPLWARLQECGAVHLRSPGWPLSIPVVARHIRRRRDRKSVV